MQLQGKPDFDKALQRVEAWFNHSMLDRPPGPVLGTQRRFRRLPQPWLGGPGPTCGRAGSTRSSSSITSSKGVIVDLTPSELELFIAETKPEGIYLCIAAEEKLQPEILQRIEKC